VTSDNARRSGGVVVATGGGVCGEPAGTRCSPVGAAGVEGGAAGGGAACGGAAAGVAGLVVPAAGEAAAGGVAVRLVVGGAVCGVGGAGGCAGAVREVVVGEVVVGGVVVCGVATEAAGAGGVAVRAGTAVGGAGVRRTVGVATAAAFVARRNAARRRASVAPANVGAGTVAALRAGVTCCGPAVVPANGVRNGLASGPVTGPTGRTALLAAAARPAPVSPRAGRPAAASVAPSTVTSPAAAPPAARALRPLSAAVVGAAVRDAAVSGGSARPAAGTPLVAAVGARRTSSSRPVALAGDAFGAGTAGGALRAGGRASPRRTGRGSAGRAPRGGATASATPGAARGATPGVTPGVAGLRCTGTGCAGSTRAAARAVGTGETVPPARCAGGRARPSPRGGPGAGAGERGALPRSRALSIGPAATTSFGRRTGTGTGASAPIALPGPGRSRTASGRTTRRRPRGARIASGATGPTTSMTDARGRHQRGARTVAFRLPATATASPGWTERRTAAERPMPTAKPLIAAARCPMDGVPERPAGTGRSPWARPWTWRPRRVRAPSSSAFTTSSCWSS
jgi:hypothetical protein